LGPLKNWTSSKVVGLGKEQVMAGWRLRKACRAVVPVGNMFRVNRKWWWTTRLRFVSPVVFLSCGGMHL